MFINWSRRELNLKVVYYGPAMSGKTTNLEQIYRRMDPRRRSELVSLKTSEDRTLFFDFLQLELGKIAGLTPKIQLYTVPGQVYYEATRKLVLNGADGVVFVADSQPNRLKDNAESWVSLQTHLRAYHLTLLAIPIVVQLNKRDLPAAISPAVLQRQINLNGQTIILATASDGAGVLETLKAIVTGVVARVEKEMAAAPQR
jgi:mutual gliding-motility protein MglA